jgi:hypothetical protein
MRRGKAMELTRIRLDRDRLLEVPQEQCKFFIALGHHSNEVNAITKLMYWCAGGEEDEGPQSHGRYTILQILLRLLAGKLYEGWRVFRKSFFGSGLSRTFEPKLDPESSEALTQLKRYFRAKNAAEIIRNNFAFHYSPTKAAAILSEVSEPLLVYMDGRTAPNTLFYYSEVLTDRALQEALKSEGIHRNPEELVSELFKVSRWFAQAADGVMDAIIGEGGQELRSEPPDKVLIPAPADFAEIIIPWFADVTQVLARKHGSA